MDQTNEESLQIDEDQKNWLLTQAYMRLTHRQFEQSLILLKSLDALSIGDARIYAMMSYIYLKINQPEESLLAVDKYLELTKTNIAINQAPEMMWIKKRADLHINKKK